MNRVTSAMGCILTLVVAAGLVLAWIVTAPLFNWGVCLRDSYRSRFDSKIK
jgi:low affinity Fe/Cu permease